jgi:hypothetical protein
LSVRSRRRFETRPPAKLDAKPENQTARDIDGGPRHPRGVIRYRERHGSRDILRQPGAAKRRLRDERLNEVARQVTVAFRLREPRRDADHPNLPRAEFNTERARQHVDSALHEVLKKSS